MMAARGDPIFIRPLAEPEYFGSNVMGIGPHWDRMGELGAEKSNAETNCNPVDIA